VSNFDRHSTIQTLSWQATHRRTRRHTET